MHATAAARKAQGSEAPWSDTGVNPLASQCFLRGGSQHALGRGRHAHPCPGPRANALTCEPTLQAPSAPTAGRWSSWSRAAPSLLKTPHAGIRSLLRRPRGLRFIFNSNSYKSGYPQTELCSAFTIGSVRRASGVGVRRLGLRPCLRANGGPGSRQRTTACLGRRRKCQDARRRS